MIKGFINEFKKFAVRGNVIDMAVGIIIGAAFGKIVDSLVKDIIMPPISILLGKMDFSNLFFVLRNGPDYTAPYVSLGNFLNASISFIIVAFAVFLLIKAINRVQEAIDAGEKVVPTVKKCPFCCTDIPVKAVRCPHCTSELSEK